MEKRTQNMLYAVILFPFLFFVFILIIGGDSTESLPVAESKDSAEVVPILRRNTDADNPINCISTKDNTEHKILFGTGIILYQKDNNIFLEIVQNTSTSEKMAAGVWYMKDNGDVVDNYLARNIPCKVTSGI